MPGGSGKGGSSQPAGVTTSVQDTSPWGPQQPYLEKIFGEAARLYDTNTPQYAPETWRGPNWAQLAATDVMMRPEGAWLPQATAASTADVTSGKYLYRNPANAIFGSLGTTESPEAVALRSYMSGERLGGAGNPYTDALTESVTSRIIPQIQSRFISGGSLGSPEAARATAAGATGALAPLLFQQQQQEEQNQINATKQLSDLRLAAASGLSDSFKGGMNDMLRAVALAPQTDALQYAPYDRQLAAGGVHQQWQQQQLNDAVQRWNFQQELPYQQLANYIGSVTGNYGGTSTLTQPYFRAPQQSALSTVGQGLGVLGAVPSAVSGLNTLFGWL